jgi:hemolysin III
VVSKAGLMKLSDPGGRIQTPREELLNALSHGLGLILALVSLPILVVIATRQRSVATVVNAALYGSTMVVLYFTSTVYHALPHGHWKRRFNRLDHASIYLFIAGSYMPFALGPLLGPWGWSLFGVVWGIAAVGTLAKLLNRLRHPLWSTGLYVAMGWVALVAVQPMIKHIGPEGLALIVAGGVAYTVGAIFFSAGWAIPLCPLHLASLRPGRKCLPLRRGSAVRRGEGTGGLSTRCSVCSIAPRSPGRMAPHWPRCARQDPAVTAPRSPTA